MSTAASAGVVSGRDRRLGVMGLILRAGIALYPRV
jgi:hypothetical protein